MANKNFDSHDTNNRIYIKAVHDKFQGNDMDVFDAYANNQNESMWSDKWYFIESNAYIFTNLLYALGVDGIEVNEAIELNEDFIQRIKPCHGLMFLFKQNGTKTSNGKIVDDASLEEMYFGHQIYKNICPTQALLSIILNCNHEDLNIGTTLHDFKEYSQKVHPGDIGRFDAKTKSVALSNYEEIRDVHNYFAKKQLNKFDLNDEQKEEYAFHFIVYIPFKNNLYELDGLKIAPLDHGVIPEGTEWLDIAQPIVRRRIQQFIEEKIHFRLMVIISEPYKNYERELKQLSTDFSLTCDERNAKTSNLNKLMNEEKRKKAHRIENLHRHNLLPIDKTDNYIKNKHK